MKIAYIVEPRTVIGGGVRAAMNLAKSMTNLYGESSFIFGTYKGTVSDTSITFEEVDTLKPISVRYWKAFGNFIKKNNPDVVHCLGLYTALGCIIWKKVHSANFKIVCTVHRVTMNMRFKSLLKFVISYIAKNIDYATFLTNYQQKHYFDNIHYCPAKFIIVPNVIYVNKVDRQQINSLRNELKEKLSAEYLTTYVGRIIPSKNIEDTIRIVALANKKGINLGAVLVGGYDSEYYKKLQSVIDECIISDKITFVGYVNNPTTYTAVGDFTTTTTHGEALPNLLVESYALGKITFSSDIPQMADLIETGKNGFTLPLDNLSCFVQNIENILTDNNLRFTMEENARKTYETKYDPEQVAEQYHDVYMSL